MVYACVRACVRGGACVCVGVRARACDCVWNIWWSGLGKLVAYTFYLFVPEFCIDANDYQIIIYISVVCHCIDLQYQPVFVHIGNL